MATVKYNYPHVAVSKYAVPRTTAVAENTTVPVLFSAFRAVKGPDNELKKIYNLSDFVNLYGEDTFAKYSDTDQELLNISNWLSNGGSVLAYRLADATKEKAKASSTFGGFNIPKTGLNGVIEVTPDEKMQFTVSSKYCGTFYNNLKIRFYAPVANQFAIGVILRTGGVDTEIESIRITDSAKGAVAISSSEYINIEVSNGKTLADLCQVLLNLTGAEFVGMCGSPTTFFLNASGATAIVKSSATSTSGFDVAISGTSYFEVELTESAIETLPTRSDVEREFAKILGFVLPTFTTTSSEFDRPKFEPVDADGVKTVNAISGLYNTIEYRMDTVLDAGYSFAMKRVLMEYAAVRDDVNFVFDAFTNTNNVDTYDYSSVAACNTISSLFTVTSSDPTAATTEVDLPNIQVNVGNYVIANVYTANDIKVGLSYFYSSMLVSNDIRVGLQFPVAGLTRGVLTGVKGMSLNPNPTIKNTLYNNRLNYVEKDSRGYKIMCQLTRSAFQTALSYVNNSMVTNRIARELRDLGREYLFEFNDSTTLNNLSNVLNKYLTGWIQNRTLNTASVEVTKISDNAVNIALNMRFTGTIEIISLDITVE